MMLQALYALALRQGLLENPDYEKKRVDFFVRIGADGTFLGLEPTGDGIGKGKQIEVPRMPIRTAGVSAGLLFDNAKYVLGAGPDKGKGDRLAQCVAAFLAEAEKALAATQDPGVQAVCRFLEKLPAQRSLVLAQSPYGTADEWTGSEMLAFVLDDDDAHPIVHLRPQVRAYFAQKRQAPLGQTTRSPCLVTGEWAAPARLHPGVKRIPNGQTSGAALVSFNADAFVSQGLEDGANAPVSRAAAEGYVTALNWLLEGTPQRRFRYGVPVGDDAVMVFWTKDQTDFVDDLATVLAGKSKDEQKIDAEEAVVTLAQGVQAIEAPLFHGRVSSQDTPFYATTLSAHARVIVRDWIETTAETVRGHVVQFYDDLHIGSGPKETPPLWALLRALDGKGQSGKLHSSLGAKLLRCVLHGDRLPRQIVWTALERLRMPTEGNERQEMKRRCGFVKAALLRISRFEKNPKWEVPVALNENNTEQAYVLGRLFALLESIQRKAQGDLNRTIFDAFFVSAAKTPGLIFPRLLQLSAHHSRKIDGKWSEKDKGELMSKLADQRIPTTLSLEEQGLFAIGYYHQREKAFEKKPERAANEGSA